MIVSVYPNSDKFNKLLGLTFDELCETTEFTCEEKTEFLDYIQSEMDKKRVEELDSDNEYYNI